MREISTEKVKIGEHVKIDGVEYVAKKGECKECDCYKFHFNYCDEFLSCPDDGIYKEVKGEPQYRPYKDTDEMIADYKERFNVSNVPSFCMPLIWVKYKNGASVYRRLISAFTDACVGFDDISMSVRELFDGYTYLDGSPCGKVEE